MLSQQLGHPAPLETGMMTCPIELWNALEKVKPLSEGLQCKGDATRTKNKMVLVQIQRAIIVRRAIQSVCFLSGDAGHEIQLQKLYTRMNKCVRCIMQSNRE